MATNSDALCAQEAANLLGAHVETIRRLARREGIPSYKVGKDWRFRRSALLRWTETHHLRQREPHVLIVDDEEVIRDAVRGLLETEGYRVATASEGEEGLGCVAQVTPDLVLLDLAMSGMNGVEFLERFRRQHPNTPVMVVTGYPDSRLMAEAMRYGPMMLLAKPVDAAQLLAAVHVALNGALEKCRRT